MSKFREIVRWTVACVFACALWATSTTAQAQQAGGEASAGNVDVYGAAFYAKAFGRLPNVAGAALSPNGQKVAIAFNELEGPSAIQVLDLANTGKRQGFRVPPGLIIFGVNWADDERIVYSAKQTFTPRDALPVGVRFPGGAKRIDYFRNGVINLTTGKIQVLVVNPEYPWAEIGSSLITPIDGDPGYGRMLGPNTDFDVNNVAVYRVDLDTGRVRRTMPSGVTNETIDYELDMDGRVIFRIDDDDDKGDEGKISVFMYDGDKPRKLLDAPRTFRDRPSFPGLLADGRLAMVADDPETGFETMYAINTATGEKTPLVKPAGFDVGGALWDRWKRRVVGATWEAVDSETQYFDPELAQVYEEVKSTNPAGTFSLNSWSRDRKRFIVYGEQFDGGAFFVYDRDSKKMTRLGRLYPEIPESAIGERQAISYRARDGVRIPAYITFPPGPQRRNLPLVLLVHGGPHGPRDTMDWDWWAGFMAARGYAVLQPNYRGSGGYGNEWEDAGRLQWGGRMQTDVEDGVMALIRNGIADANRVCIVGASYGGYSALAGATLTPDRYRCAVSVNGVSDLPLMLTRMARQSGGRNSLLSGWWRISIGDITTDRERIEAVSPYYQAAKAKNPVLIIHGTDDTVVPIEQGKRMYDALKSAGKPVEFVELTGDDHNLSDGPTRIQTLAAIEAFLARNIGGPATETPRPPAQ